MNKVILMLAVAATAVFAQAEQYWAAVYSEESDAEGATDANPGTAQRQQYSGYYCTVAAAQAMFGSSEISDIESYLTQNFAKGKSAMGTTKDSVALTGGEYGLGQYSFIKYGASAITGLASDYLAVLFYGDDAFRVFGADNAVLDGGRLKFSDKNAVSGSVGDWTAVPEPTSALLMLLGLAGLALKRKPRD